MACSTTPIVRTEYIRPEIPSLPPAPVFYEIRWFLVEGSYCLDAQGARDLLKNIELLRGSDRELRQVLTDLKNR